MSVLDALQARESQSEMLETLGDLMNDEEEVSGQILRLRKHLKEQRVVLKKEKCETDHLTKDVKKKSDKLKMAIALEQVKIV